MLLNSQRTIYGVDLSLSSLLGKEYNIYPNSTLNEKLKILNKINKPKGIYPKLNYWAIGCGGGGFVENNGVIPSSEHSPFDASLFEQIPFITRKLSQDQPNILLKKYKLRRVELINNEEYACYYLKVFHNTSLLDKFYRIRTRTLEDGSPTSEVDLTDISAINTLNPSPKNRQIDLNDLSGSELYCKIAKLEFALSEDEIKEINYFFEVKGGGKKNITEIAACSGIDFVSDSLNEAICVQINFFFGVDINMSLSVNNAGHIIKIFEIGGGEGLIGG